MNYRMYINNLKLMNSHEKILLLLILVSFILKLCFINQYISVLLNKFLADDAFYYFSLVRNVMDGSGIVFNYGIPTNGFHPLYALILIPIFKLTYSWGINVPIYASLTLLTIFSTLTSIFLYLIASKILNKEAGLLAAFIWLFNPYIFFASVMGLEVPLQILLISLLTYFLLIKKDKNILSFKESSIIGFIIGLIFLSRMDGIFIGIGVVIVFTINAFKNNTAKSSNLKKTFINIITIVAVSSVVILPWICYNLIELNQLFPVSGEALRIMRLNNLSYFDLVINSLNSTIMSIDQFFLITNNNLNFLFLVLMVPFYILALKKDYLIPKLIHSLDFLIISSIIYYLFYWFYELGFREWYSLYTSFLMTIFFSIMIIRIIQKFKMNKIKMGYIVLSYFLIFAFILGGIIKYNEGNFPQEKVKWEIANYVNLNIPANETIASFNTGIYRYYTNRDVINLDGVMNPDAYRAIKDGNIEHYIIDKKINYIIDPPYYIKELNSSKINLEPIKKFEIFPHSSGTDNEYIVYKVVPNN